MVTPMHWLMTISLERLTQDRTSCFRVLPPCAETLHTNLSRDAQVQNSTHAHSDGGWGWGWWERSLNKPQTFGVGRGPFCSFDVQQMMASMSRGDVFP